MPNKTTTTGVFTLVPKGCMKKKGEEECGAEVTHYTVSISFERTLFAVFACASHAEDSNNKRKAEEN